MAMPQDIGTGTSLVSDANRTCVSHQAGALRGVAAETEDHNSAGRAGKSVHLTGMHTLLNRSVETSVLVVGPI